MSTILDFVWTNGDDVFEAFNPNNSGIVVSGFFVVNTLSGDDTITGTGFFRGISNSGTINTGNGNDTITGTAERENGIVNLGPGVIETGNGNDIITGTSERLDGIVNLGIINTGNGKDIITGTGLFYGISNVGTINTGSGDDIITGRTTTRGRFSIGINNRGTIDTGNGNDIVDALTGGFFGGGTILLGNGDDLIRGSQNAFTSGLAQKVDGGRGFDTAELGIDFNQGMLSRPDGFDIAIGGMWYKNVELFVFNDAQYDLASLQNMVP